MLVARNWVVLCWLPRTGLRNFIRDLEKGDGGQQGNAVRMIGYQDPHGKILITDNLVVGDLGDQELVSRVMHVRENQVIRNW